MGEYCMCLYINTHLHHLFIHSFTFLFIHPFIHLFMYASINSFIHPSIHPSIHSFIHPSIHPSIHPFIHSFIHPSIHPFIHPFIHLSIHSFIHPFIHPSIHSFIHPSIHSSIHLFILSFYQHRVLFWITDSKIKAKTLNGLISYPCVDNLQNELHSITVDPINSRLFYIILTVDDVILGTVEYTINGCGER